MSVIASGVCGLYAIVAIILGGVYFREKQKGRAIFWLVTGMLSLGASLFRFAIPQ